MPVVPKRARRRKRCSKESCKVRADFYVYLHRRNDTNEIFYVGKGRGDRAESVLSRTLKWYTVACTAGRTVEYLRKGLSEEAALKLERETIATMRTAGSNIVNVSSGGGKTYMKPRVAVPVMIKIAVVDTEKRVWMQQGKKHPVEFSIRQMVSTFGCSWEELADVVVGKIVATSDGWYLSEIKRGSR